MVLRTMRRLGMCEADADDLAQEAFVVIHRRLPSFEGRSLLSTWIYGICVRVAADHRKRAYVRRELSTDTLPEPGVAPEQEAMVRARQARATLDAVLASLDDDKRAVFVLFELEEVPMVEVALAVGVPLQTAYSRLHAARRAVAECIAAHAASELQ